MFEFHPLANIFPLIEGADFENLVADIKANGLNDSIVLHDEKILDGRNRYRACREAGIEPRFVPLEDGKDPVAFVVSANLARRHLSESQRAMAAVELATFGHGGDRRSSGKFAGWSQERAAKDLNVSERSVRTAVEVKEHGAPELVQAVRRGDVSVSAAADVATLPVSEQVGIVARGEKEILAAAKSIRAEKARVRYAARVARIAEVSAGNAELPSARYPVIYADPAWDYKLYNETTGSARAAAEHYPTMKLEDICALDVAGIATPDAILFMWTTAPHLQESFEVLAAWGFEYKTHAVWVKHAQGLGFFVRGQHELLLIATKGNIPCPLPSNRPSSVIEAPRREHSRKPDEAYELIERMYPELPKIELFARNARDGWACWGNQAPAVGEAA
jgi:N6-adenosine-specific RNA methylase IME4/ParB-like chromosome segregation protein Spo0J